LIRTLSNTDSFLVFNDSYDKGWKAFIDNQETKIYRTNYALRGLIVPEGEHKVYFIYRPDSFTYGLAITVVSLVLLLVVIPVTRIIGKRESGSYT
jgi:uncharacterized membrane protein YfhO